MVERAVALTLRVTANPKKLKPLRPSQLYPAEETLKEKEGGPTQY